MIRIYGDWVADVYERGFIVGKVGTEYNLKLNREETVIKDRHYFHELSEAVLYAYQSMIREEIGRKRKDITLEDTVKIMRDIERKMEANTASWNQLLEEEAERIRRAIK